MIQVRGRSQDDSFKLFIERGYRIANYLATY